MSGKRGLSPIVVTTFCKYSKICTYGSMIVLIPIIAWAIWEDYTRYYEPHVRFFHNVKLKVAGAAKSPPTIIIYKDTNKVFFVECTPQMAPICQDKKYWEHPHSVKDVSVIETRPRSGYAKSITIENKDGSVTEINDTGAESWHLHSAHAPWRAVHFLAFVFILSVTMLIVCHHFNGKMPQNGD